MSTTECCGTCKHCVHGQSGLGGLCRLRKIVVHPEVALMACCHHWTRREPSLPMLAEKPKAGLADKQLDFERAFAVSE